MLKLSQRHQSYIWLLTNTVMWGAAFVLSKPAFETTTPFRFLFYRFLIAAILVIPLLWRYRRSKWTSTRTLLMITGVELIAVVTLIFLWGGLALTTAIEANLIATTAPVFVVLLGIWWLKERQEKVEWLGLSFALVGTLLIVALPLYVKQGVAMTGAVLGNISIVIANLAESVYFILAKNRYHGISKLFIASFSFYISLFCFAIFSLAEAGWSFSNLLRLVSHDLQDIRVILAAVYMAIGGSLIGLTAYIKGQDGIEASEASFFRYLQPLVYIPLGIWLLHEQLYALQAVALVLIVIGFLLSEQREGAVSNIPAAHADHQLGMPVHRVPWHVRLANRVKQLLRKR